MLAAIVVLAAIVMPEVPLRLRCVAAMQAAIVVQTAMVVLPSSCELR